MKKKVLVTGGTGFLGEAVVQELRARDLADVITLARTSSPLLEGMDGVENIVGDILTGDELERAIVVPAHAGGVQLEPGLVSEIVAGVGVQ